MGLGLNFRNMYLILINRLIPHDNALISALVCLPLTLQCSLHKAVEAKLVLLVSLLDELGSEPLHVKRLMRLDVTDLGKPFQDRKVLITDICF